MIWFILLILATGAERIYELVVSTRNAKAAIARGGREFGQGHFPWMVTLHTVFLLGCIVEVFFRPFIPGLGWPMLAIALACQVGRYWCIRSLGEFWNTRVIIVPGTRVIADRGPYRWLKHPNYWIVAIEGVALPLVHTDWITAIVFTALNAVLLLRFRIPIENEALNSLAPVR